MRSDLVEIFKIKNSFSCLDSEYIFTDGKFPKALKKNGVSTYTNGIRKYVLTQSIVEM